MANSSISRFFSTKAARSLHPASLFHPVVEVVGPIEVRNQRTIELICQETLEMVGVLPSSTIVVEKIVDAVPNAWPSGNPGWDPVTGFYVVEELLVEPLPLNIAYDDRRIMPRTPGYDLENFTLARGLLKGRKVGDVLAIADRVLSGEPVAAFGIPTCAELADILANINANYEFVDFDTFTDRGYLIPNRAFGPPDPPHDPVIP